MFVPIEDFVLEEGMEGSSIGVRKDDIELQSAINEVLANIPAEEREAMMAEASAEAGE